MFCRSTCLETAEQLEYRETHQRQKIKASLMTFTSVKIVGLLVALVMHVLVYIRFKTKSWNNFSWLYFQYYII